LPSLGHPSYRGQPKTGAYWQNDRSAAELPSREDALRIYTQGRAKFTFEDGKRGVLAHDRFADLAVLSSDVLAVPTQDIGNIESLLTIVGGKVVYAAGPYRDLETQ
jgi:predicted amidohydrolase YtcJ